MKAYLIKTGAITALLIIAEYLTSTYLPSRPNVPFFTLIALFFFGVSNTIHFKLVTVVRKNINRFNPWFMGLSMLKMFVYIIFALVYLWFFKDYAKAFLISLFVTYVIFTGVEISAVTRLVKQKNS